MVKHNSLFLSNTTAYCCQTQQHIFVKHNSFLLSNTTAYCCQTQQHFVVKCNSVLLSNATAYFCQTQQCIVVKRNSIFLSNTTTYCCQTQQNIFVKCNSLLLSNTTAYCCQTQQLIVVKPVVRVGVLDRRFLSFFGCFRFLSYWNKNQSLYLVSWLWEETHVPKVVGSNPGTVYWMDMTFFTFICCKNCNDVCLKRRK